MAARVGWAGSHSTAAVSRPRSVDDDSTPGHPGTIDSAVAAFPPPRPSSNASTRSREAPSLVPPPGGALSARRGNRCRRGGRARILGLSRPPSPDHDGPPPDLSEQFRPIPLVRTTDDDSAPPSSADRDRRDDLLLLPVLPPAHSGLPLLRVRAPGQRSRPPGSPGPHPARCAPVRRRLHVVFLRTRRSVPNRAPSVRNYYRVTYNEADASPRR